MTAESDRSRYFQSAKQAYIQAATISGASQTKSYLIGGHSVQLCFANESLSTLFSKAMEHICHPGADHSPDLKVYLWDTASTDVSLTPPDWNTMPFVERGNRRMYSDDDHVLIYDRRTSAFNMIDLQRSEAIYWVRDSSWLPYYEIAAPLRYLFQGWLQSKGSFLVHSGAVGFPHGGALIMGPTGSGKSTTSLSCLRSTLRFAGDDYILVCPAPQPTAFSLYNSAKVNVADLEYFHAESRYIANQDRLDIEKALIFLHEGYKEKLIASFPIRVLLLPRVGKGAATSYQRLDPTEAFKRIAPDSVFTMLGNARLILQGIRDLSQSLPSYEVNLGEDRQALVQCIAELIEHHGR